MPSSAAPNEKPESRRRARRIPVLKAATLVFGPEKSTLECNIRDLTANGARLHAPGLPEGADVTALRLGSGVTYRCWTIWRENQNLGVEFAGDAAPRRPDRIDRRKRPREATVRPGQIVFQDGHCTIACTVTNLSNAGALIQPRDLVACPEIFELRVKNGPTHTCKVVRAIGNNLAVRFLDRDE